MAKTLSLTAISFNEAEHLDQWVNNHRALADEIVLVDTESTDGTQAKARELKIKLIEAIWHDNFSEAKNIAIRHSKGDWILFLSPDYWIDPENFAEIRATIENTDKVAFLMPIEHHYADWTGENKKKTTELTDRESKFLQGHVVLFRNDPDIFYENRVHESVNASIIKAYGEDAVGWLHAVRHHDNTKKQISNPEKMRYYQFIEDISAIERKTWEHGHILRKRAYDKE